MCVILLISRGTTCCSVNRKWREIRVFTRFPRLTLFWVYFRGCIMRCRSQYFLSIFSASEQYFLTTSSVFSQYFLSIVQYFYRIFSVFLKFSQQSLSIFLYFLIIFSRYFAEKGTLMLLLVFCAF